MGMDRTISNFIRALRNAEVRVSTAETLDAISAVELVGYSDKAHLKRSLSMVLPKTADEKETFDACFDNFFRFQDVRGDASADANPEQGEQEGCSLAGASLGDADDVSAFQYLGDGTFLNGRGLAEFEVFECLLETVVKLSEWHEIVIGDVFLGGVCDFRELG